MNNIGRNKTNWLKKQGCKFTDYDNYLGGNETYTQITTEKGEYIGLADLGKKADIVEFIYKHRLTNLMSRARAMGEPLKQASCNTVCIGFSEREQMWYGWTHRGYGKFGIWYEVKPNSIMDREPHKYPFKVKTLDQAKQLAIDISDYLD